MATARASASAVVSGHIAARFTLHPPAPNRSSWRSFRLPGASRHRPAPARSAPFRYGLRSRAEPPPRGPRLAWSIAIASAGAFAIEAATASASACTSSKTRATNPSAYASSTDMVRPVKSSSLARRFPITRCRRCVAPTVPHCGSGKRKLASREARMKSQAIAISPPEPTTGPFTTATTGLLQRSIVSYAAKAARRRLRTQISSLPCRSFRSAPAQNTGPAASSSTTRIPVSESSASNVLRSAMHIGRLSALRASGRLSSTRATAASRRSRTGPLAIKPRLPLAERLALPHPCRSRRARRPCPHRAAGGCRCAGLSNPSKTSGLRRAGNMPSVGCSNRCTTPARLHVRVVQDLAHAVHLARRHVRRAQGLRERRPLSMRDRRPHAGHHSVTLRNPAGVGLQRRVGGEVVETEHAADRGPVLVAAADVQPAAVPALEGRRGHTAHMLRPDPLRVLAQCEQAHCRERQQARLRVHHRQIDVAAAAALLAGRPARSGSRWRSTGRRSGRRTATPPWPAAHRGGR